MPIDENDLQIAEWMLLELADMEDTAESLGMRAAATRARKSHETSMEVLSGRLWEEVKSRRPAFDWAG